MTKFKIVMTKNYKSIGFSVSKERRNFIVLKIQATKPIKNNFSEKIYISVKNLARLLGIPKSVNLCQSFSSAKIHLFFVIIIYRNV